MFTHLLNVGDFQCITLKGKNKPVSSKNKARGNTSGFIYIMEVSPHTRLSGEVTFFLNPR